MPEKRRKFHREFREGAVRLVTETGKRVRGERMILVIPPPLPPAVAPPGYHAFEVASLLVLMTRIKTDNATWGVRLGV